MTLTAERIAEIREYACGGERCSMSMREPEIRALCDLALDGLRLRGAPVEIMRMESGHGDERMSKDFRVRIVPED